MKQNDFQAMRREYMQHAFDEKDVAANPFEQFSRWFQEAQEKQIDMPNAMTLASASLSGKPSVRTVLMKQFDDHGFVFFTNYQSAKAQNLNENPFAALLFYWPIFDRQIRIEGHIERVSKQDSEEYFKSRPIDSQISASISPQSHVVANRQELENNFANKKLEVEAGKELTLPEHWGGYLLKPNRFEFWQGRENRLHDRLVYEHENGLWLVKRLAP